MSCIYGLEGNAFNAVSDHADLVEWFSPTIWNNAINAILSTFPVLSNIYKPSFFPYALTKWFYEIFDTAASYRQQFNQKPTDFLTFILACQSNSDYSNKESAAFASMFFFDAFETTSIMLAQALYHLADNVDCQRKLRNEIDAFLSSMDDGSSNIMEKMPYLDNVVHGKIVLVS